MSVRVGLDFRWKREPRWGTLCKNDKSELSLLTSSLYLQEVVYTLALQLYNLLSKTLSQRSYLKLEIQLITDWYLILELIMLFYFINKLT